MTSLKSIHYLQAETTMNTPLPQELIDQIVDDLQDDHAALKCMSLTSRAFYPRTRPYLFRKVELVEDEQAQKFAALCRDSPDIWLYPSTLQAVALRKRTRGYHFRFCPL